VTLGQGQAREHGDVLTIGQLAHYAGVSIRTIRVYHAKELLPEPERDASGYRRYSAQHVIDLLKIRALAEAGVPLARIREIQAAPDEEFESAIRQVDRDLSTRIQALQDAQRRLRRLTTGALPALPHEVSSHLQGLPALGFSPRWISMLTDLWILVFATHPDAAIELFRDQAESVGDARLRQVFLDYDRAHDLDPDDPRIDDLARRIVVVTRSRYGNGDLPGQVTGSQIPALIQAAVNASSPAWQRIDALIRAQLQ
jgi:DNA-binding transcriptional MerR regulator